MISSVSKRDAIMLLRSRSQVDLQCAQEESFKIFQGRILEESDRMVDEFGLTLIDATRSDCPARLIQCDESSRDRRT